MSAMSDALKGRPRRLCKVDGCDRPSRALDWCNAHWRRAHANGGDPLVGTPIRVRRRTPVVAKVSPCSEQDCGAPARSLGLCHKHYSRMIRHGSTAERSRHLGRTCSLPDCSRRHYGDGLCSLHHQRWARHGDPDLVMQQQTGEFRTDTDGYRKRIVVIDGRKVHQKEHRAVMEDMLGRPLVTDENVHHINGDRSDNRPVNLELWSTKQPKGQRIEDKVEFAVEMLERYAPHLLAAHFWDRVSV